jgi:hypothetical protein
MAYVRLTACSSYGSPIQEKSGCQFARAFLPDRKNENQNSKRVMVIIPTCTCLFFISHFHLTTFIMDPIGRNNLGRDPVADRHVAPKKNQSFHPSLACIYPTVHLPSRWVMEIAHPCVMSSVYYLIPLFHNYCCGFISNFN